jgi:hypothetical protein
MGKLWVGTLNELEKQTAREVNQRPFDSPMLPRVTASRLLDVRDANLLDSPTWDSYNVAPSTITPSRLLAQTEQQSNPTSLGGVGQFTFFDATHPAWIAYVARTRVCFVFVFVYIMTSLSSMVPSLTSSTCMRIPPLCRLLPAALSAALAILSSKKIFRVLAVRATTPRAHDRTAAPASGNR